MSSLVRTARRRNRRDRDVKAKPDTLTAEALLARAASSGRERPLEPEKPPFKPSAILEQNHFMVAKRLPLWTP